MDKNMVALLKGCFVIFIIGVVLMLTIYTVNQEYRIQHLEYLIKE